MTGISGSYYAEDIYACPGQVVIWQRQIGVLLVWPNGRTPGDITADLSALVLTSANVPAATDSITIVMSTGSVIDIYGKARLRHVKHQETWSFQSRLVTPTLTLTITLN
jgi:hypothetical protein